MSTPAEIVATWLRDSFNVMDCSFDSQRDAYYEGGADALSALSLAGYVVVKLPMPDEKTPTGMGKWFYDEERFAQGLRDGGRWPIHVTGGQFQNADTARALAAALLSAADAAEVGGSDV